MVEWWQWWRGPGARGIVEEESRGRGSIANESSVVAVRTQGGMCGVEAAVGREARGKWERKLVQTGAVQWCHSHP